MVIRGGQAIFLTLFALLEENSKQTQKTRSLPLSLSSFPQLQISQSVSAGAREPAAALEVATKMAPSARGGSGDRGGTGSACALPGNASGEGHTLFCASWVKEKPLLGAQPRRPSRKAFGSELYFLC